MFALACLLRASSLDIPAQMCSPLFALLFLHVPEPELSKIVGEVDTVLATLREPPVCSLTSAFTVATSLRATQEGQVYSDLEKNLPVYSLGEGLESGWAVRRLRVIRALFLGGLGILDVGLSFLLLPLLLLSWLGGSLLPLLLCLVLRSEVDNVCRGGPCGCWKGLGVRNFGGSGPCKSPL